MKMKLSVAGLMLLALAGCAAKPDDKPAAPPAPPPVEAPKPPPTDITLEPSDLTALQTALKAATGKPIQETVTWTNPETGRQGTVKMLRDGFDAKNRPCREFHSVVFQGQLFRHQTGFICRQPDGSWEVVDGVDYPVRERK
ncbi:RT0821/Lpp0805 family surface protein [Nitrospirillum sp. BR 11752]|uniref:RT0821/Lpp0805 family surface protein n=1 Tax=Nitrospirillum sp. BR 11752 TaxID=3104293 RepID=UPI002ECD532F|nr:RT0821/Lpp0805 family surface protein [Nitrospirillum sp. BR 11752]